MPDQAVSRAYATKVAEGVLREDASQLRALHELDQLAQQVSAAPSSKLTAALSWMFMKETREGTSSGIYLVGRPGRGKTMLMDMFFKQLSFSRKRRVHFNAFMQDVHERVHAFRGKALNSDVVAPVARAIAKEFRVLCLDEFQVRDIADAMLLGRLFGALFSNGVAVVITSNTEPDFLYENGLNRQLFLPFIAMIKERMRIVALDGPTDYRVNRISGETFYVFPLSRDADQHVARLWQALTDCEKGAAAEIRVNKRILRIPQAARGVARFSFADLCEAPLGPADYLAIARTYDTVFIERIPVLNRERQDTARRFITAIDVFHDSKLRLVASAAALPADLGSEIPDFARTASRLNEMRSPAYGEKFLLQRPSKH